MEVAKKLFTVDEYHRMGEAGIFHPEARLELLEGCDPGLSKTRPGHTQRLSHITVANRFRLKLSTSF